MSAEHTPAPWKVIPSPHGPRYACVQLGKNKAYTTLELEPADARLIAAAPTMYDFIASLTKVGNTDAMNILESIHAGR